MELNIGDRTSEFGWQHLLCITNLAREKRRACCLLNQRGVLASYARNGAFEQR